MGRQEDFQNSQKGFSFFEGDREEKLDSLLKTLKLTKSFNNLKTAINRRTEYINEITLKEDGLSPGQMRLLLGYFVLAHQAQIEFITSLEGKRSQVVSGLDQIISVFTSTFTTKDWLYTRTSVGRTGFPAIALSFDKAEVPQRKSVYRNNINKLTLGMVLEEVSSSFRSEIDDETFSFFCECIIQGIHNGEYSAGELVSVLLDQATSSSNALSNPNVLPKNLDKIHYLAWRASSNIHVFGIKFAEKWRNALVNPDDECFELAVDFLQLVTGFMDHHSSSTEKLLFSNFIRSAVSADILNSSDFISFLRKLERLIEETGMESLTELLERGYQALEAIDINAPLYEGWENIFTNDQDLEFSDAAIRELILSQVDQISSVPNLIFTIDSRELSNFGHDAQELGVKLVDNDYCVIDINLDPANELLDVVLRIYSQGHDRNYQFAFDYISNEIRVILNVIDQDKSDDYPQVNLGAKNLVTNVFNIMNQVQSEVIERKKKDAVVLDKPKLKKQRPVDSTLGEEDLKKRKKTKKKKEDTSGSSFINEVIEQNRLMPIVSYDENEINFEFHFSENELRLIKDQIDLYNKAVKDGLRMNDSKSFKAKYRDPDYGWRIVQIRLGDFRILCRVIPDTDSQEAEVYWVGNRKSAWKHYVEN